METSMEGMSFLAKAIGLLAAIATSLFLALNLYFGFGIGGCDLPADGHFISRFLCSYAGFIVVMSVLGLLPVWGLLLFKFFRRQQPPQ
jgi:hypothetical protein